MRRSRRRVAVSAATLFLGVACQSAVDSTSIERSERPVTLSQTSKPVTLVVGQSTRFLSSRLVDGGEWRTDNPDVAFVSSDGTVSPTQAGVTKIIHRGEGGVDTIPIAVRDPVDSIHLGADLLSVHVGRSTKLRLRAFDQGTAVPPSTDLSPTWTSTSPSVATVDPNGVVTATGVGCAAVVVNVDTKADTEMVAVAPSGSSGSSSTPSCAPSVSLRWTSMLPASIQVGQTAQISAATPASGSGAAPTVSAPVSYSSSDATVADVSGSGLVKGNGAGDALLTASSNGQSISADLAVVPASGPTVAVVNVSFSKSEITVGDSVQASALAIAASGQPITGLAVTWSVPAASAPFVTVDASGKVRSIAPGTAQISATIAGVNGSAPITIDAVSATPPGGQTPASVNPAGAAAVLALMGPAINLSQAPAPFSWYQSNFKKYSEIQWGAFGPRWDGGNSNAGYDRAAINYVWWALTGDTTYLNRAHAFAVAYRDNYLIPAGYAASPHWSQMESLYLDCQITQDSKSCAAIPAVADRLSVFPPSDYFAAIEGEARIEARVIVALWMAEKVTGKKSALLDMAINRSLSSMNESGFTPFTATCGGSLNFMNGMLYDVLTRIHDQRPGSYNGAIEKNAIAYGNYLWSTQWRGVAYPGDNSFNYMSVECSLQGSPTSAPDLNGLMLPMFGWLGKLTGDQTWFTRGDAILSGMTGADIALYKQFSESYTSSYRYFGYRFGQ